MNRNLSAIIGKPETPSGIIEVRGTQSGEVIRLRREPRPNLPAITGLILNLRKEPKLLLSRINPDVLDNAFTAGSAVAYGDFDSQISAIEAFGALWPSKNQDWLELGTLWVAPKYRGAGVAKAVFETLDELAPGTSLFLLTADPVIVGIAIRRGWKLEGNNWLDSRSNSSFPWTETIIGPLWDRYPDYSPLKEPGLLLYKHT